MDEVKELRGGHEPDSIESSPSPKNPRHEVKGTLLAIVGHIKRIVRSTVFCVLLFSLGFTACFLLIRFGYLSTAKEPVLNENKTVITSRELQMVVEPASDLLTCRYRYTDAAKYYNSKIILDFDIPITRDIVVFTYSGVVGVGYDIDGITFDVTEGTDEEKGQILVALPELKVIQNEIDPDSFNYAFEQYSIFNQHGMPNTTEIFSELKQKAYERALSDEQFLSEARTNAETTIQNFLEAAHVNDYYTITFASPEQSVDTNE